MNLATLIPILLQLSLGLVVFCIALRAQPGDLTYLLRRPGLLVRSILSMNVVMPLLAIAVAVLFDLRPGVEVALILLSISAVPPILPGKQGKAGGNVSYAIGLLTMSAALAIVVVPASVAIIGRLFGRSLDVPVGAIATIVAMSVLAPLVLGAVVRQFAPAFAERVSGPISKVAQIVLLLAFIPVLIKSWPAIAAQAGDFTILAIVLFTAVGLAVGHVLGGPDGDDRTVLALSTACRHPGIALAVAESVAAPDQRPIISGAVFLAFLLAAILTIPYVKLRARKSAAGAPSGAETA